MRYRKCNYAVLQLLLILHYYYPEISKKIYFTISKSASEMSHIVLHVLSDYFGVYDVYSQTMSATSYLYQIDGQDIIVNVTTTYDFQ